MPGFFYEVKGFLKDVKGGNAFAIWRLVGTLFGITIAIISIAGAFVAANKESEVSYLTVIWLTHLGLTFGLTYAIAARWGVAKDMGIGAEIAFIKACVLVMTIVGIIPLCLHGLYKLWRARRKSANAV
tara:strand:+ start:613 stop:996 length:384 start_codon:yes stop_codon:yes gene_type:complete